MKTGEEVTRKIQRRRRRRNRRQPSSLSESTPYVPPDLTSEILSKLPAKHVQRFRCVSKLWSSIITDPYFINKSFETQSSTRPMVLVNVREGDKLFVFSISQHDQNHNRNRNMPFSYSNSQPVDGFHTTYPKHHCPFPTKAESVHGLILFHKSPNPMVWNPSMRKFSPLPKPVESWTGKTVLLGYDPIERKHKVLCMHVDQTIIACRVLTLGSPKEQWRRVETKHNHCPLNGDSSCIRARCVGGVVYYLAKLGSDRVIMSFDVRSEKFHVIILPRGKSWRMMMMSYQGKLACVGHSNSGNRISMWVLEGATKHEWSNHLFLIPQFVQGLPTELFTLIGINDDGEFIYVRQKFVKYFYIIYNDPKRETIRIVLDIGIMDDDFRRRNGLGERRWLDLQIIPNHIETLLSL